MVRREPKTISETEFAIMNVLWECDGATVREIVVALYQKHTQSLHAGTRSLLDRLAEKGYVTSRREEEEAVRWFSATIDRETFLGRQLQQLADSHFDGSLLPILLSMVERVKLNKKDRQAIREMIKKIE